ncbi:MAG: hypothetical protein N2999_05975 [Proteobacteria bacterium]|nr:hypothetical protein [Pseudomonadota bacterium]
MHIENKLPIKRLLLVALPILFFSYFLGSFFEHIFPGKHALEYIHFFDIISEAVKTSLEISGIILGVVYRKDIKNWLYKAFSHRYESTGDDFPFFDNRVEAIIIPVSRIQQPEWIINFIKPKYVSFVYTTSNESKNAVKELIRKFRDKVKFEFAEQDVDDEKFIIKDPDDPKKTKLLVKHYIAEYIKRGIDKKNIFVDTTGGKVPMSIGAFQAAEEMGVSSIYLVGKGERGLINDPSQRKEANPIFLSEKK